MPEFRRLAGLVRSGILFALGMVMLSGCLYTEENVFPASGFVQPEGMSGLFKLVSDDDDVLMAISLRDDGHYDIFEFEIGADSSLDLSETYDAVFVSYGDRYLCVVGDPTSKGDMEYYYVVFERSAEGFQVKLVTLDVSDIGEQWLADNDLVVDTAGGDMIGRVAGDLTPDKIIALVNKSLEVSDDEPWQHYVRLDLH